MFDSPNDMETVFGVVTDCMKLNTREEANSNADIVCVIDALSELIIIPEESTDEWFKVCTETGAEGYCMSRYITIQQ